MDIFSRLNFKLIENFATTANTTDVVSDIVDTKGLNGLCFLFITGAITGTGAFTPLIEYGDDSSLSDAAAVPDAELNGTEALAGFTPATDNVLRKVGVRLGNKRYYRATVDMASNDGNVPLGIIAVTLPNLAPTPNPPA